MSVITITKLYDSLAVKLGKETAENLTTFIEHKIDNELESKTTIFATKDDFARAFASFDSKISELSSKLDSKIGELSSKLDSKIGELGSKLESKINESEKRVVEKIHESEKKMIGIIHDSEDKMVNKIHQSETKTIEIVGQYKVDTIKWMIGLLLALGGLLYSVLSK